MCWQVGTYMEMHGTVGSALEKVLTALLSVRELTIYVLVFLEILLNDICKYIQTFLGYF